MTRDVYARRRMVPLAVLAALAFIAGLIDGRGQGLRGRERGARVRRGVGGARLRRRCGGCSRRTTRARPRRRSSTPPTPTRCGPRPGPASRSATSREEGNGVDLDVERADAHLRDRRARHAPADRGRPDRLVAASRVPGPDVRGEAGARDDSAPARAKILARDGSTLVEGPASARVSPLGTSGAEIAGVLAAPATEEERNALYARGFEREHARRRLRARANPRGAARGQARRRACCAGTRVLAASEPQAAEAGADDDRRRRSRRRPRPRWPAGSAASRRSTPAPAAIRGLAGIAFSAPQPPGSTFKIITTTAALEEKLVKPSTEFPIQTAAIIDGVELENANGESCGGSFADSFAHSCNSVFAPLGVKVGAEKLVETAERYGFNEDPGDRRRRAEHAARSGRHRLTARAGRDRDRPGPRARDPAGARGDGPDRRVGRRSAHADRRSAAARAPSRSG